MKPVVIVVRMKRKETFLEAKLGTKQCIGKSKKKVEET